MTRRLAALAMLIMLAILIIAACQPGVAAAQSATPTPTSAPPAYTTTYQLSSGNSLLLERRWTFGDLFVGLSVVALTAVTIVSTIYEIVNRRL